MTGPKKNTFRLEAVTLSETDTLCRIRPSVSPLTRNPNLNLNLLGGCLRRASVFPNPHFSIAFSGIGVHSCPFVVVPARQRKLDTRQPKVSVGEIGNSSTLL